LVLRLRSIVFSMTDDCPHDGQSSFVCGKMLLKLVDISLFMKPTNGIDIWAISFPHCLGTIEDVVEDLMQVSGNFSEIIVERRRISGSVGTESLIETEKFIGEQNELF